MKRILAALPLCLAMTASFALADSITIHPDLPPVDIAVTGSGVPIDEDADRPYTLCVTVSRDGQALQQLTYAALDPADANMSAARVIPEDVNFDGYSDLLLCTAQGASNLFQAVSLYNPEAGAFDPVLTHCPWDGETRTFASEPVQLELINVQTFPELRILVTTESDGYAHGTKTGWQIEGRTPTPYLIAERYDTDDPEQIGERVTHFATQVSVLWDAVYPHSWYYGQEGLYDDVYTERMNAIDQLLYPDSEPQFATVANTDWVNVRLMDSKASEAIAGLDAGAEVRVLGRATGKGEGWVRVLICDLAALRFVADSVKPDTSITGYIWHSFLRGADGKTL